MVLKTKNNPITKLSGNYQSKLIEKVQNNFTNYEQQLFLSSFYCYLKYDNKKDFVIDLDNVWKWLDFSQKAKGKELLEKSFIKDIDYKFLLSLPGEQKKDTRGGHIIYLILLNDKLPVNTILPSYNTITNIVLYTSIF